MIDADPAHQNNENNQPVFTVETCVVIFCSAYTLMDEDIKGEKQNYRKTQTLIEKGTVKEKYCHRFSTIVSAIFKKKISTHTKIKMFIKISNNSHFVLNALIRI